MTATEIASEARAVFQVGLFLIISGLALLTMGPGGRLVGCIGLFFGPLFLLICHVKGYWAYLP